MPIVPPAGSYPISFFVPTNYSVEGPPGILAYGIDPRTFEIQSLTRGVDPIDAQVVIALTTYRASGTAVRNIGARWFDVGKLDGRAARRLVDEASFALSTLVRNRDIRVGELKAEAFGDDQQAAVFVSWYNLRAVDKSKLRTILTTARRQPELIQLRA